jgi:DNA-binding beta-propeller fold protein YncE
MSTTAENEKKKRRRRLAFLLPAVAIVLMAVAVVWYLGLLSGFVPGVWREKPLRLTILSGSAEVMAPQGNTWASASDGMLVFTGYWVRVAPKSSASLANPTRSATRLDEGSLAHVDYSRTYGKQTRTVLSVRRGNAYSWVDYIRQGYLVVRTQTAVFDTRGGIFNVSADDDGVSSLDVALGTVTAGALAVSSDGRPVVALMGLSNGDTLRVPSVPQLDLDRETVEGLQGLVADTVRRFVDRRPSGRSDGIELLGGEAEAGATLFALGRRGEMSIPERLPVPEVTNRSVKNVPGMLLDYRPVLSIPRPPEVVGSWSPKVAIVRGAKADPPRYVRSVYDVSMPLGVAVSPDGDRIYVTEGGGDRMTRVFGRDGSRKGALAPPDTSPVNRAPVYVAVAPDGSVYVQDGVRHVIDMYDAGGGYHGTFDPGLDDGDSWTPLAIGFSRAGRLYATDISEGRQAVLGFTGPGAPEFRLGKEGSAPGEFLFPNGIVLDGKGGIFVADSNNHRIQVISRHGDLVGTLLDGNTPLQAGLARGLAIDSSERLHIVDAVGHRVLVYQLMALRTDVTARPLFSFGDAGTGDGEFNYPNGIAVDQGGTVYVADRENNRVQVWRY